MEWGAEIPVNGVRPAWLGKDEPIRALTKRGAYIDSYINWLNIESFCLPASHFAYAAIAKGFEPWSGGDEAPADWDQGEVLFGDGNAMNGCGMDWRHCGRNPAGRCLIIGYHKRQPSEDTFTPNAKAEPSHVTVKRMTQAEAETFGLMRGYGGFDGRNGEAHYYGAMRDLGLIRPETHAERIATKTGLTVAQVEAVLAADKENK